ncbi:MAG: MotA/TolQ/ExbB proton channel family protein [Kiritimatiellia bacterium]|jgi:biopolymer transport protein ExbB
MHDMLTQGGPVLWFILFIGLVALFVFLERALHLHRARIDAKDFLAGIFNIIRRGNITEAIALCEETPGPVARLVSTAIQRRELSRDRMIDELDEAGRAEISRMERRLSLLALVAQITPLAGLLGVVHSILNALIAMNAKAPFVSTADITSGLIPGAITTAAGLLVAIPCFIGFHVLVVNIDRLVLDMRAAASEIVFFFDSLRGE